MCAKAGRCFCVLSLLGVPPFPPPSARSDITGSGQAASVFEIHSKQRSTSTKRKFIYLGLSGKAVQDKTSAFCFVVLPEQPGGLTRPCVMFNCSIIHKNSFIMKPSWDFPQSPMSCLCLRVLCKKKKLVSTRKFKVDLKQDFDPEILHFAHIYPFKHLSKHIFLPSCLQKLCDVQQ